MAWLVMMVSAACVVVIVIVYKTSKVISLRVFRAIESSSLLWEGKGSNFSCFFKYLESLDLNLKELTLGVDNHTMPIKGLNAWINKLSKQNAPVLGQVISELNALTGDEASSVNQLVDVILKDPHLTSHVLRVANSVQYNYSDATISTVSKAIVLLGIKGVRAICISLLLIDSLVSKKPKEHLLNMMARGFHAAAQARNLARLEDEEEVEEVFIAALLFNLGEMMYWSSEKLTDANARLMVGNPTVRKAAAEEVLGTSFAAITLELAKHWKLGETLEQALKHARPQSKKAQAVRLAEHLSREATKGWDTNNTRKIIANMARCAGVDEQKMNEMVRETADQAAHVALSFGVPQLCHLIPSSQNTPRAEQAPEPEYKTLVSDPQLQLKILRELTNATAEKLDVNSIFHMVIEGMHRGIGLERVAIAFIKNYRAKAKYILGQGTEPWREGFDFDVDPYSDNIFTYSISQGGTIWFDEALRKSKAHLYTKDIQNCLGKHCALVSVLTVGERSVAVFYADRGYSEEALTRDQFESFQHFSSQAQMSLIALSSHPE